MKEIIVKRLGALLSVKSLVTLLLSGVFAYLAITGQTSQEFMTVYTVVIAFYFGTQTQIISDAGESIVKMGNKNYSLNERGMNIVVLDNTTRNIVDKVRFKTYYVMLSATR